MLGNSNATKQNFYTNSINYLCCGLILLFFFRALAYLAEGNSHSILSFLIVTLKKDNRFFSYRGHLLLIKFLLITNF